MTSLPYLWHFLHCISSKSSGNGIKTWPQQSDAWHAFRPSGARLWFLVKPSALTYMSAHVLLALSSLNITQIWPHPSLSSLNVQSVFLYALSVKMEIMAVFFINNAKRWLPLYRCLLFVRIVRGQDCPVSTAAPPLNWERGPCIVAPAPSFILFLLT